MQEYTSKQIQILRPAEQIYQLISRFDNLTPVLQGRVDDWQATEDRCSFKAKGFGVTLIMAERVEPKHVKITGEGVPMDFAFWVQLHKVSDTDTRLRLVLHTELNMMMKMLIGSKLQGALDQIADGLQQAMR
ncbi:MAG: SRPBCC family protein [Alistipes sp.]|nr:SRPBCC family protein [Alistipes sp.]MBQ5717857.1 SRPBCC family protein [Alistipes sp.]MBQ6861892.1 SRPBCC family protein [Alistipes sp.]